MQKRITLFVLCLLFITSSSHAQVAYLGNIESLSPIKATGERLFVNSHSPTIYSPVFEDEEGNLVFSWDAVDAPSGCKVIYELNLYPSAFSQDNDSSIKDGPALFTVKTEENEFRYGSEQSPLVGGTAYKIIINTYLIYPDRTEMINGAGSAYVFEYIPFCIPPSKIQTSSVGIDNFDVSWNGPKASPGGIGYILRYRIKGHNKEWEEMEVSEGTGALLEGLDNRYVYEVQVRKICPSEDKSPELYSEWSDVVEVALSSIKSLTLPPCGSSYTPEPCDGISEILTPFDTLFVGGFPILVDTMWIGGQYSEWHGSGWVPLPFGDSLIVKVEWGGDAANLVKLDTNGVLCSGTVRGIKDDMAFWPDLSNGPNPFGGAICLPLNSAPGFDQSGIHSATGLPWDENGFGPSGTYDKTPPYPGYEPGDLIDSTGTYDPMGFDADGNHFSGGTTNENGCTREQLLSQPQTPPCDSIPPPYYWLDPNGNPATQGGNALANEVSDSLQIWINHVLDDLQTEYQGVIDAKDVACDSIRDTMDLIIAELGYDWEFIYGKNKEYFYPGMYARFTETPEPLSSNIDRPQSQQDLENKHIDLYHCDKDLHIYIHLLAVLVDMQNNQVGSLADEFKDRIKHFSEEQAALYSNLDSLYNWLEIQIKLKANQKYDDLYGYIDGLENEWDQSRLAAVKEQSTTPSRKQNIAAPLSAVAGNYLASNISDGELNEALIQSMDFTNEDISFQFKQGWRMINGVHRAYYLEAIAKERKRANLLNSSFFTANDNTLMPILLDNRGSDGKLYRVYLDDIVFRPTHATLNAFIVVEMPHNGQRIVFEAMDVLFGPTGAQAFPIRLGLANDIPIRLNNAAKLTLKSTENTYVSVNCDGFAGIGVEAEVEICRNYVKPLDAETDTILADPARVHGKINTFFPNWNQFYVEISMDPFVVTGVEDFKWHINTVAVDFSDEKSPASPAKPPVGYTGPFVTAQGGFQKQWRGFYMANFSATLPEHFTNGNAVSIGVEDAVIDDLGFSGRIYASNILDLVNGNAGGWAFSIDMIDVTIIGNDLKSAGLHGLIHVPIISNANDCNTGPAVAADCMGYDAFIEPGNRYIFKVKMPGDEYCIDMWKAGRVVLDDNTTIAMKLEGGDFDVIATLFGKVQVNGEILPGIGLNVSDIKFEKVEVSNKSPYFSPGVWKFPATIGQDFGGFGFSIDNLSMVQTQEGDPALKFGAQITIGDGKIPLSAKGGFLIIGEKVEYNGRHRWKFKKAEVKKIFLSGSLPGVKKVEGLLEFFSGHNTYGSGFRGGVTVAFEGFNGSFSALGHFGKKDHYKYFFVDALACVKIPIVPGIDLTGFGGGAYYRMGRTTPGPSYSLPVCAVEFSVPEEIGTSLSGINYMPNQGNLLGVKSTVAIAAAKETVLNANATFEIAFKESNGALGFGIDRVDFYGNARLMAAADKQASPEKPENDSIPPANGAVFNANISVELNLGNKTLTGNMVTFLNTPVISGTKNGGRMNQTEMYFGPDMWYVRMGRPQPDKRNQINFTIPGTKKPLLTIGSYFQVGSGGIDPMPDLPSEIYSEFGLSKNFSSTFNNRGGFVHNGGGFILGATANIDVLDFDFKVGNLKVAEAELKAMLGFDVSVLDWGSSAVCAGSGNPVGINGWYAQGQIYGGMKAGLSVAGIDLASVQIATALQARFPNPFWAKGSASVSISTPLGNPSLNVNVELGDKCDIVGVDNPVVETPIIATLTPANGMSGVPVETNPVITFLMPIGETFGLPELGNNSIYKPVLDHAKLLWNDTEIILDGEVWNEFMTELTLITSHFLPSNDTLVLDILAHVDSNGITIHTEHRLDTFSTGAAAQKIFEGNVVGSYPFDGQFNFYKQETSKGYIILDKSQPELFQNLEGYNSMRMRWKDAAGDMIFHHDLTHEPFENKIEFSIPEAVLANEQLYTLELVRASEEDNSFENEENNENLSEVALELMEQNFGPSAPDVDNFPIQTNTTPYPGSSNSPPVISQNNEADSTLLEEGYASSAGSEIIVYSINFRVSRYNTFRSKIDDWAANREVAVPGPMGNWPGTSGTGGGGGSGGGNSGVGATNLTGPGTGTDKGGDDDKNLTSVENYNIAWLALANETTMEPFDVFELKGYKGGKPLVNIGGYAGFWGDHPDYLPGLIEKIYEYFPDASSRLSMNREVNPQGAPPNKAMRLLQDTPPNTDLKVSPEWVQSGSIPAWAAEDRRVLFVYDVFRYYSRDYSDFKSDAIKWADEAVLQYFGEPCPVEDPCFCIQQVVDYANVPQYIFEVTCGNNDYFPAPPPGDYPVMLGYTLPGEAIPRSFPLTYVTLESY